MSKTKNQLLGQAAEDSACLYLEKKGFLIADRNYRFGRGEIDLIVEKDEMLVFVEVKYRSNSGFGHPEEFVTDSQRKSIIETADQYIYETNWQHNIRFDIIAIDEKSNLEHFEDAFY